MADRYWVGGTGTWDATQTAHWATSSGGAPGASAPTINDRAIFDANSFSTASSVTLSTGATCGGWLISGITIHNCSFQLGADITMGAGIYSFQGTPGVRVFITAQAISGLRRLTINGTHGVHSDVMFAWINLLGTAGTLSGTRIGDHGGNQGAFSFSPSETQTWQGTAGGNWSDPTKWTTRVPLPQDDVFVTAAFAAGQTITGDTVRLGRNLTFSPTAGNPTFTLAAPGGVLTGSITCGGTWTLTLNSNGFSFQGVNGNFTIQQGGKVFRITLVAPGCTYTALSDINCGVNTLSITYGILDGNGFNVTAANWACGANANSGARVGPGTPTWTFTTANGNVFNNNGTVWDAGLGTIVINAAGNPVTFAGAGKAYNVVRFSCSTGNGALTITGNNTFATLDIQTTTARTLTTPANGTQTVSGTLRLRGVSGQLLSLVSATLGTPSKYAIAVGTIVDRAFISLSADVTVQLSLAPSGGIVFGGSASLSRQFSSAPIGGLVLGGSVSSSWKPPPRVFTHPPVGVLEPEYQTAALEQTNTRGVAEPVYSTGVYAPSLIYASGAIDSVHSTGASAEHATGALEVS